MRKFYAALFISAIVLIFMIQNAEIVEIRFLFWQLSISRALMLMVAVCAGLLLGLLLGNIKGKSGKLSTGKPSE